MRRDAHPFMRDAFGPFMRELEHQLVAHKLVRDWLTGIGRAPLSLRSPSVRVPTRSRQADE
jgi:hypothetical protein